MHRFIKKELIYGARNYLPEEICIQKGFGCYVFDTNNRRYLDFISLF